MSSASLNNAIAVTGSSDGFIIVPDVPQGLEFGINSITYEIGPKFKGLSCVPPGLHFLYHGSGVSDRQGYFQRLKPREMIVRCWDASNEELSPYSTLSAEAFELLQREVLSGALNENLGPYPAHQHVAWQNMTSFISDAVLERADCAPGTLIFPGDESDLTGGNNKTYKQIAIGQNDNSRVNEQSLKPYYPGCARVASFTQLKAIELKLIREVGAVSNTTTNVSEVSFDGGAAITALMMDKSQVLEYLVNNVYHGSDMDLLGELQLAFILFMMLFSAPALQQWKELMHIICTSEKYLQKHEKFAAAFIRCLYSQLSFAPNDFFDNELSVDNFLRPIITSLFSSLSPPISSTKEPTASSYAATLFEHKKRLRKFVQKKFDLQETMPFSSVDEHGSNIMYEEEDFYNLNAEDMPMIVSEAEIADSMKRNHNNEIIEDHYFQRGGSTAVGAEALMDEMHIEQEMSSPAEGVIMNEESQAADSYTSRWAALDTALQKSSDLLGKSSFGIPRYGALQSNAPTSTLRGVKGQSSIKIPSCDVHAGDKAQAGDKVLVSDLSLDSISEREAALYSWRYPLVYESMLLSHGKEDMTMAAMRIIEEYQRICGGNSNESHAEQVTVLHTIDNEHFNAIMIMRYKEANQFVEYELGNRQQ